MGHEQVPGPGQDGEELGSSPSPFPGKGEQAGPGGFADGGPADVMAAGAELARLLAAATADDGAPLGSLGDQEVLGVVAAGARMAAWAAWMQLTGLAEFARRRPGAMAGSRAAREAAEEAGWKTTETWTRMLDQLTHAVTLTGRLPRTLEAMRDGHVSDFKARIIEAQTAELCDADVAKADVLLAAAARVKNPAGLRDFARRQVTRLDPQAADRRKQRARRDAYVRFWQEDSGNAGLVARQMPTADAVIAWGNIERRALDLHAAGVEGTAGQLQVQAALDFLLGRATPGRGAHQDAHPDHDGSAHEDAHPRRRGGGRGGWAVNPVLLVPWDPSLGAPSGPAELPGFGQIGQHDTIDLLRAAGDSPATRWCLTVHGHDGGAAIAHGCAPGRRTLDTIGGAGTAAGLAARLGVHLTPVTTGACQHAHAEPGYKPSRTLSHLIQARNTRCTAPGCDKPAAACDLDHTVPWEDSHLTCECNMAPLCRAHHQIKQGQGWKLEQPEPGILIWVSPSGLTRTTRPGIYQNLSGTTTAKRSRRQQIRALAGTT